MNKNELILNYLYESNKIPVWIFEGKKLIFTSAPKNDLRCEEELYAFFGYFLKKAPRNPSSGSLRSLNFSCLSALRGKTESS